MNTIGILFFDEVLHIGYRNIDLLRFCYFVHKIFQQTLERVFNQGIRNHYSSIMRWLGVVKSNKAQRAVLSWNNTPGKINSNYQ